MCTQACVHVCLPVVELRELGQSQNGVQGVGRQLHMPGHPEGQGLEDGPRKSIQDAAPETWWPGLAPAADA